MPRLSVLTVEALPLRVKETLARPAPRSVTLPEMANLVGLSGMKFLPLTSAVSTRGLAKVECRLAPASVAWRLQVPLGRVRE